MSQSITPAPITNIYPWQVTSEYHYPCPRASTQHPSPTSTPGRSPVSITIHVSKHHPCSHHQHLPWQVTSEYHQPCLRESPQHPSVYPWQVTSEYHHPCPKASPSHSSPTSTPGRSPVSITTHVSEHHPSTHHQHLPLAGHQ